MSYRSAVITLDVIGIGIILSIAGAVYLVGFIEEWRTSRRLKLAHGQLSEKDVELLARKRVTFNAWFMGMAKYALILLVLLLIILTTSRST